jgi:hypothetical protein
MRPICINPGCGKFAVPVKGRVGQPGVRYRVFCGECHISSYSGTPLRSGVVPFKKNQCSNLDGRLGFPCITDHTKFDQVSTKGKFDVDHIDGNPHNNDPANLQELCTHCHEEKGLRQGDFDGHKKKDNILIDDIIDSRNFISRVDFFNQLFEFDE